jgi:restriction system protein
MARRRGFFAELAHQAAVAEKNRQRAHAAAVRAQAQRQREAERAHRAYAAAVREAGRQSAHEARMAEMERQRLHREAQEAEVERLNGELALELADIDNVLLATLEVDDYVDLERLRRTVSHPPFQSRYSVPIPPPPPIAAPPEPVYVEPEPPRGIGSVFGGKRKHADAVAAAQAAFAQAHQQWQQIAAAVPMQQLAQLAGHKQAEEARQMNLAADRARYEDECAKRQREVDESNAELEALIRDLERGAPDAVEEYLGIVFGNSVYPADWPWPPAYSYDANTKELSIQLQFPAPGDMPTVRQYKYVRANDEITATPLTQKQQRERYAALVNNMTLRTLHEVWEADRGGHVASISLVGSVSHVDPATGKDTKTPLVAVAVDRRTFDDIDLRRVAPAETMRHLGAVVSKNPHALTPIKLAPGVRAL